MNIFYVILYEVGYYGPFWLWFVAVAFFTPRYLGCFGVLLSLLLVGLTLLILDTNWISDEMRNHPENGRDADFVFGFGVLCRAALFNLLLVPASILGFWLFKRRRQASSKVTST